MLSRELTAHGFETTLVAGACGPDEGQMDYILQEEDRIRWVPELSRSVSLANNLAALWRIWKIIREERPTIVHTHTAMAGAVGRIAAIANRTPIIVHTFHGNVFRHYFSRRTTAVFLFIERLLARFTDAICAISEQQLKELSGEFRIAPQERFRLVRLGLDLKQFQDIGDIPRRSEFHVSWIGRLVSIKNVPYLAEVVKSTIMASERVIFHVAGDGPDSPVVKELVREYPGRFIWHGWQQDVKPIIEQSDVLIQTSLNEGTPVSLIQGMAAGRPFVSTSAGGVVDLASGSKMAAVDGAWFENCVLVDSGAASFARVLTLLANDQDLVAGMGEAARRTAQIYHKDRLVADVAGLYHALLRSKLKCEDGQ